MHDDIEVRVVTFGLLGQEPVTELLYFVLEIVRQELSHGRDHAIAASGDHSLVGRDLGFP